MNKKVDERHCVQPSSSSSFCASPSAANSPVEAQFRRKYPSIFFIAPKYTAAYNFSENLAGVKKWEKWGFIDIEGNEVIPFIYSYVSHFQSGIAQVIIENETYCINHKGERVDADIIEVEVPIDVPDKEVIKKFQLPPSNDGILE